MPFRIRCTCGQQLTAPDDLAGKAVRCPQCKRTFTLPSPGAAPAAPRAAEEPDDLIGALGQQLPGIKPRPPGASTFGVKLGDSGVRAPAAPTGPVCPFCQAPREPGTVICVKCGLNFETGERISIATEKPPRERPKKNVLLVALNVVYRPLGAIEEIGGYAANPLFVLWMWVFVAGTLLLEVATRVGLALARQGQAGRTLETAAAAGLSLAVLLPLMLAVTLVGLLIDAGFCYLAGKIFGVGAGFLRLLLNLGFVGGVVRVASLLLLVAAAAGMEASTLFLLFYVFFLWQVALYVAVLAHYYDLPFFMALGIGVIAWLIKLYSASGILTWLQGAMGA